MAPDLVHLERAGPGGDGATGDARRASGEFGEVLLALKVEAAVRAIRTARGF